MHCLSVNGLGSEAEIRPFWPRQKYWGSLLDFLAAAASAASPMASVVTVVVTLGGHTWWSHVVVTCGGSRVVSIHLHKSKTRQIGPEFAVVVEDEARIVCPQLFEAVESVMFIREE